MANKKGEQINKPKRTGSSLRKWRAEAPSNLALIKYMGKKEPPKKTESAFYSKNLPLNSSLSLTLNHFVSLVEIEQLEIEQLEIEQLEIEQLEIEQLEIEQPETEQPEIEQPEIEQPEIEQPEIEQPEIEQPETEQPEIEQPETEQPETEQPEIEQPEIEQLEIERAEGGKKDSWLPFPADPFAGKKLYRSTTPLPPEPLLSLEEQKKFLNFFRFLKSEFSIPGNYKLRSANNFPRSAGAASSASSFAALTRAAFRLAKDKSSDKSKLRRFSKGDLSRLSRMGSGSSCRSFFSPLALWEGKKAAPLTLSRESIWSRLIHQLIIAETKQKPAGSSHAHELVKTSPLFPGRKKRAEKRLADMLAAMRALNWKRVCKLAWDEQEDLHSLFETASPPLLYKTSSSRDILQKVKTIWEKKGDGPLATMDAGANVHLLCRPDQKKEAEEIKNLFCDYIVLSQQT